MYRACVSGCRLEKVGERATVYRFSILDDVVLYHNIIARDLDTFKGFMCNFCVCKGVFVIESHASTFYQPA